MMKSCLELVAVLNGVSLRDDCDYELEHSVVIESKM